MSDILIRFEAPTYKDKAPYKSLCYVIVNETDQDIYKQISPDTDFPRWKFIKRIKDSVGIGVCLD